MDEKIAVVRRKSVPARDKGTSSGEEGCASSLSSVGVLGMDASDDSARSDRRDEESPRERSLASAYTRSVSHVDVRKEDNGGHIPLSDQQQSPSPAVLDPL